VRRAVGQNVREDEIRENEQAPAKLRREVRKGGRPARYVCSEVIRGLHNEGYSFRAIARATGIRYGTVLRAYHGLSPIGADSSADYLPQPLNVPPNETRLFDILRIADEAFDNRDRALSWLREPNIQIGDERPIDAIGTVTGFRAVKTILRQIQYGVFG
jgi:hypothetical protein